MMKLTSMWKCVLCWFALDSFLNLLRTVLFFSGKLFAVAHRGEIRRWEVRSPAVLPHFLSGLLGKSVTDFSEPPFHYKSNERAECTTFCKLLFLFKDLILWFYHLLTDIFILICRDSYVEFSAPPPEIQSKFSRLSSLSLYFNNFHSSLHSSRVIAQVQSNTEERALIKAWLVLR